MIAVMTELDIEHVVRDGQGMGGRLVSKNEFCFWIDEFPDEPGRSDTVDFRPCEITLGVDRHQLPLNVR
jgi:hypothetical protein